MNFFNKLSVIVNKKYGPNLVEHQEGYFCNKWWCYRGHIETLQLSDLKPNADKGFLKFNPEHSLIKDQIVLNGFDYSKGHITVSSQNFIIDGHHRYYILKELFSDEHQIRVIKLDESLNFYEFIMMLLRKKIDPKSRDNNRQLLFFHVVKILFYYRVLRVLFAPFLREK